MAELLLEGLTRIFSPNILAVQGVSLRIHDGEFLVLVGPSGSGKSTLLRLIAGLERPSAGSLTIGGRCVDHIAPARRDVGMVFQKLALYPHMNVRRNLEMGLRLQKGWQYWWRGRSGSTVEVGLSRRVTQVAELLGLNGLLERRPRELSGGQQQRVALGRALVRDAAVYLLDEPLSHLDVQLRAELRRELHLLQKQLRATMVYVTHDPVEAMTLADRVVVLDGGEVQQVDRPTVVYDRPANRRVAGFFGWPPMNLLDGSLEGTATGLDFVAAGGAIRMPLSAAMASVVGSQRSVSLGIRAEHLRVMAEAGADAVAMEVRLIEPFGAFSLVALERSGLRLTVSLADAAGLALGRKVGVVANMDRVCLFDGATGRALAQSG
jgi:ABC-type sugar transport system ATPase subunit